MPNAIAIVAHPDDETIWMAGKILREKSFEWTVLSLCRKDDPDRKPKFFKVCSGLNCRGFISDMDDEKPEQNLPSLDEAIKRIEPVVHDKKFDFVFTHGSNGEYGHKRHAETHSAVLQMAKQGLITFGSLFTFDYLRLENPFRCVHNPDSDARLQLSGEEFARKKFLIRDVYGFSEQSFEFMSCSGIESFRKVL